MRKHHILWFILFLTISACSKNENIINEEGSGSSASSIIDSSAVTSGAPEGYTGTGYDAEDLIENSVFSKTVSITYGSSVTVNNPMENAGVKVSVSGGDVVITSSAPEVEYQLSGKSSDGSVKVYSDKKFKMVLNSLNLSNSDGPAINIQSSKRAFIVVADQTSSSLSDGTSYTSSNEDMKGCIFSEGQLIFSGNGNLNVKGNYKHGIASDDYVRVLSGNLTISGAVTDGIHTNDAFIADGGTMNITAGSDGIEAEEGYVIINSGNFTLNTGDDGIAASYTEGDTSIDPYVTINGGSIKVKSTGGEGIESKSVLTINKGEIITETTDDGLNAGTAIYINGGNIYAYSSGNDAMDSNGIFIITGGKVVAVGARAPEASIDCDARTLKISGGILIGIGGATSAPSATLSTVHSVVMGSGSGNQIIHIEAADGTEVLTFMAPASYSTLICASAKLKGNSTYKVLIGGSVSGGTSFNGLYGSGTYSGGTQTTTFTTTNILTQTGGSISRG